MRFVTLLMTFFVIGCSLKSIRNQDEGMHTAFSGDRRQLLEVIDNKLEVIVSGGDCLVEAVKSLPECSYTSKVERKMKLSCLRHYGPYSRILCKSICSLDRLSDTAISFENCYRQIQQEIKQSCRNDWATDEKSGKKVELVNEYLDCLVKWLTTVPSPQMDLKKAEIIANLLLIRFMVRVRNPEIKKGKAPKLAELQSDEQSQATGTRCSNDVRIVIDETDLVFINGQKVDIHAVQETMSKYLQRDGTNCLNIRADQNATNAILMDVIDAAKNCGYSIIDFERNQK